MSLARLLALLLVASALSVPGAAAGAAATTAASSTSNVVVSQVFGGGGNSGAAFTHDYVELFNRGSGTAEITGWTIQYATAAGTSWQATPLSGTIPPGRYYLVQLASGGTSGSALPTPEATGTSNLAAGSGKIALVRDGTALTCGASAGSCSANALVADLVGYGSASDYEGAGAAPTLRAANSGHRAGGGCIDTDANGADFAAAAPAPRNGGTAAHLCQEPPPPPSESVSQSASVDVEVDGMLSIALERATLSFGRTTAGATPAPISERVTVVSNNAAGYALAVDRSAFTPADLPLAIQASAPAGGILGAALAGGAFVPVPVRPAPALTIGTTSTVSAPGGDIWPTNVGFASPIPPVAPGRYTATLTYTVIAR